MRDGMGNPHEDAYFYDGYRDAGQSEAIPQDLVFDPTCDQSKMHKEQVQKIEQFLCAIDRKLRTNQSVYITKAPAFLEPPFFSKPTIKVSCNEVQNPNLVDLLVWEVPAQQRLIVTSMGLAYDNAGNPAAGPLIGLKYWFEVNDVQALPLAVEVVNIENVVPIFDETSDASFYPLFPIPVFPSIAPVFGQVGAAFPGTPEDPYNLLENGLLFLVKGPGVLKFRVQSSILIPGPLVTIYSMISFYQYWVEPSSEFEKADIQV